MMQEQIDGDRVEPLAPGPFGPVEDVSGDDFGAPSQPVEFGEDSGTGEAARSSKVSSTSGQCRAIRLATLSMKVPSPAPISNMRCGGLGKNFLSKDAMIGA